MIVELGHWPMPVQLHVTRVLLGCSQAEMSNKLGISVRTYQGWESHARPIPYRTRQWLVVRLGELVEEADAQTYERMMAREAGYGLANPIPAE